MRLHQIIQRLKRARTSSTIPASHETLCCESLEDRTMLATFGGYEYVVTEANVTWDEAQAEAEQKGGWLVIIDSAEENEFLQNTFADGNYFIGLTDRDTEGNFLWTSGVTPEYTNWASWEPNNWEDREDHAVINTSNGLWFDWDGNYRGVGIIEIPPTNELEYNGNTYQLTPGKMSWEEAQQYAESIGGNLVQIDDAAENQWLINTFGNDTFYIGANDIANEGEYFWTSGQPLTYSNWAPWEPNNWENREDHSVLQGDSGYWFDWDGRVSQLGIIEIPGTQNPGNISLESSVFTANENDNQVEIVIQRTGGSDGIATVDYQTVGITASPGSDFVANSGTITFADGQTSQTVVITLLDDAVAEPNELFAFTIDNVSGAELLVPRTATVTIIDNDADIPAFTNFPNSSDLQINGSTTVTNGRLRLTNTSNFQAGSAFFDTAIPINESSSFQSQFEFQIRDGNGTNGADGMAFIVQNNGLNSLGAAGGGLGYQGIGSSLAIEFDTYRNSGEVNNNHISVVANGNLQAPLATGSVSFDLNNSQSRFAWIEYNGNTNVLAVFLSTSNTKPDTPVLTTNVDLTALVGNQYYAGFAAATGGANNRHEILNWQMSLETPPNPNPPTPGDTVVAESLVTGLVRPTAIDWSGDGQIMYVAQQDGLVRAFENGTLNATPFIDIQDQVNGTRDRGLLDIAVHPDFENNPYVYLLYTYDPPEVYDNVNHPLAGPDKNGNRAGRLTRVTADAATGYATAVPGSEVVLLGNNSTWENFNAFVNSTVDFNEPPAGILPDGTNLQDFINSDSDSHTIGGLAFGPNGELYVSIGDGASYNRVDPRAVRVQDIDNLSGKVLRIDPITGQGLADNPFYNGDPNANRSKVYQYGLRNPFRISVDQNTGAVYVGDVGWTRWEEVNSAGAGANFGWPYFEGGSGTNIRTPGYQDLPEAQAFYSSGQIATPAIFALSHAADGINAIVMGDVYSGSAYSSDFVGNVFFNDLGQGIVRRAKFNANGELLSVQTFTTGANIVVQIAQGPDGLLYFVDLDGGFVGRWLLI